MKIEIKIEVEMPDAAYDKWVSSIKSAQIPIDGETFLKRRSWLYVSTCTETKMAAFFKIKE